MDERQVFIGSYRQSAGRGTGISVLQRCLPV